MAVASVPLSSWETLGLLFPQIADMESGKQIQLINRKSLRALTAQLLVLLMSWEGAAHLSVNELKRHYETTHSVPLNPCEYGFMTLTELLKSLPYLVEVRVLTVL